MSVEERWRVAVHEAGHTAAALHTGCDPTRAGVFMEGGGFTEFAEPRHPFTGLFIMSCGRAAEDAMCGPTATASQAHVDDREMASRYAERCAPTHYAGLRVMAAARAVAERFVRDYADVIAAIAGGIMEHGVIDRSVIAAAVAGVFHDAAAAARCRHTSCDLAAPHRGPGWNPAGGPPPHDANAQDEYGRPLPALSGAW
ncbi:unnamed protein product [Gemmataceae bacterium]|nr:unnamed protein product [Gemmataceae bacterium]VTT98880.1 unnamed protein product [Gemmataceae bacterium]